MPRSRRRQQSSPLWAGLIAVLAIVAVTLVGGIWLRRGPSALDKFYELPEQPVIDVAERGQILKEEPIDDQGTGARAFRVLYRTVGVDGEPVAASGFVAWPSDRAPAGGYPIVAFGHSTVGLADDCAPSRGGFGLVNRDAAIAFLEAGFAVAAADYPGLGVDGPHPYAVGETTGASVVDIVRAARDSAGDQLSDRVVGWGYSQGGHAVLWARALAARDAPELQWRGTVSLAPITDPAELTRSDDPANVLGVAVAAGQETRGLSLAGLLTDAGQDTYGDLEDECISKVIEESVDRGEANLTDDRAWTEDLAAEVPPTDGAGPALVIYGDRDDTVGTDAVAAWVERAAGAGVEGRVLPGLGHGGLVEETDDDVLAWMRQRVDASG